MGEKKAPRNGVVDVMRLGFAGLVMMYHFYSGTRRHFPGGWFGVEFFVILAGFLMFSAWEGKRIALLPQEKRKNYWFSYMKKRYARFFWYALISFLGMLVIVRIWHDQMWGISILDKLSRDIWEILLLIMNGFNRGKTLLNGSAWTLGCMLFAEFFIQGMLVFHERHFLHFLMPVSIVLGSGWWMNLESDSILVFHTFFTFGMFRVYLLTCCGILSYVLCKKLKAKNFSNVGRGLLTIAELGGYMLCILISCYRNSREYQFCFILIATVVLAVSFSGKSFAGSMLPANRFTNFCAEYSLGLYLTHDIVLKVFKYTYVDLNDMYRQKFIFLYCALTVALGYTYIMRGVFKMLPIVKEKLKRVMLERP